MKNIKFLIVVVLSIKFLWISSYAHATTKQDNEPLTEPQKTVRIIVDQSYSDRTNPITGFSFPFESIVQRFVKYTNLIVVAPETKDADYTLTIQASGEALGAQYLSSGDIIWGQYAYTGASLSGTITLKRAGVLLHQASFSGKISPSSQISFGAPSSPDRAPFYSAFDVSGFEPEIGKMFGEVFGSQFFLDALKNGDVRTYVRRGLVEMGTAVVESLITALKSEDTDNIRKNIVEILGEIQDSRAIEPLIETLKNESTAVQKSAVEALKKITKQSVGDTYEAWFKWWQENKD